MRSRDADETSTILARAPFRRHGPPLPFYDVLAVWRDYSGRLTTGSALRWVPAVGATRTYGAQGPVWSRAGLTLTAVLNTATHGLRPRPAAAFNEPLNVVGAATAATRRKIDGSPVSGLPPGGREPTDDGAPSALLVVLAGAALVAIATTAALRRRKTLCL